MIPRLPEKVRTVIVAPLNWGLGHATRSIPVIDELLSRGINVVLASDGEALELLRQRYPGLKYETLPSYNVKYRSDSLWGIVLGNFTNVWMAIQREKSRAKKIVFKHGADMIISDSRFGFRSDEVFSVIISHQLQILADNKLLYFIINTANRFLLNSFNECWVPDFEDHRLSGKLSMNTKINDVRFIGPLSTMGKLNLDRSIEYDLALILSGPEPARTNLEKKLALRFYNDKRKVIVIRGTNVPAKCDFPSHWTVLDRVTRNEVENVLKKAEKVISRSGYSSIMDYHALGIKAEMIPTPGQTEQEYLAMYHA